MVLPPLSWLNSHHGRLRGARAQDALVDYYGFLAGALVDRGALAGACGAGALHGAGGLYTTPAGLRTIGALFTAPTAQDDYGQVTVRCIDSGAPLGDAHAGESVGPRW